MKWRAHTFLLVVLSPLSSAGQEETSEIPHGAAPIENSPASADERSPAKESVAPTEPTPPEAPPAEPVVPASSPQSPAAAASPPQPPRPAARESVGEKDDVDDDDDESPQFMYFGVGPALFASVPEAGSTTQEYGLALSVGGRHPIADHIAINGTLTWGLTTFSRTERWWRSARGVGSWTTRAYGNVTEWAQDGQDDESLRWMGAFFAYIGLLFPYAASGLMYIGGPFAATSSLDFQLTASFHLMETRLGPYLETGLGVLSFVHPDHGELKGGLGPSFGAGYDFGWFGVNARGLYSPRFLHGESSPNRTDLFTGTFLFRFQGK